MKKKNCKNSKKVNEAVNAWQSESEINTDTLGSYTGIPSDDDIKPEQDADDL